MNVYQIKFILTCTHIQGIHQLTLHISERVNVSATNSFPDIYFINK